MMIFVVYSAIVWWAAAKWRRTWRAFVAVSLGLMLVAFLMIGHERIFAPLGLRMVGAMLKGLLYPYIVLLGLVGYYIAILPRPLGEGAKHPCTACGYDLVGAEEYTKLECPECGVAVDTKPLRPQRSYR